MSSSGGERDRALAWDRELTRVHELLRGALVIARASVEDADGETRLDLDLQTFCVGFCAALDGHHRGEDAELFPVLLAPLRGLSLAQSSSQVLGPLG